MSRIGKKPIPIPENVKVEVNGNRVKVKGKLGEIEKTFPPDIKIEIKDNNIVCTRKDDSKKQKELHGLTRAIINNMIKGVQEGFKKILEIHGMGYKAEMQGKNVKLFLGYSHPITVTPIEGVELKVEIDENTKIPQVIVSGIDKEKVGLMAAMIRSYRKPEPYKGKGIRYKNEQIRKKEVKKGV
jgi:large subunit ribosomal protein L6|uniref:Large ribosomal subunit protein uL6 n=1 Tax=candidate division WOR-3 bacterium TaxID=2052148 RepID=A0A7C4U953_UNCW3